MIDCLLVFCKTMLLVANRPFTEGLHRFFEDQKQGVKVKRCISAKIAANLDNSACGGYFKAKTGVPTKKRVF